MATAKGTFDIQLTPGAAEVDGAVARFEFTKSFHGELEGSGVGLMLSAGDPGTGSAGYVAIEIVDGTLDGRSGSFAFQQFGTMSGGALVQHYEIVPGSGKGGLAGIGGTLTVTIVDGVHEYVLDYDC